LSVGGSVWYMIRNLRCTVTIDSVLANSKTQNAFLFTVNAVFRHDYPLAVEPGSTPRSLVQKKKTWRDSLPIDMFLSAVAVLVVVQSSSVIPEGLMINPVCVCLCSPKPRHTDTPVTHIWLYCSPLNVDWQYLRPAVHHDDNRGQDIGKFFSKWKQRNEGV